MRDVRQWLDSLGLGQYGDAFEENAIDWRTLPELDHDLLKDIGVKAVGHRVALIKAIHSLNGQNNAASELGASSSLAVPASEAERRQLTVMFCDLVGSTALSTQLDPEDLRDVITTFQDTCRDAISRYDGFIARYMGDGVLVYFGYPQAYEDAAERAVHAGLAVTAAVADLRTPNQEALAVRTGIATGLVVVGDLIGEGAAQEKTVVGETPNLAARLQGLAEPGTVVISDGTRRLLDEVFELRQLGTREVKGFTGPIALYAVAGERATESRFEARQSGPAMKLVGRDEELALMMRHWGRVCAGEGQIVQISGEAGIGKSRFLRGVRERLEADSGRWISYQCSPYHADSALHPVIQQLIRAAQLDSADDNETKLDKLETLLSKSSDIPAHGVPLLAVLLGIDSAARYDKLELDAQQRRDQTLQTILLQVFGLAKDQPIILAVEDAHWIDPTTLELIERMCDVIAQQRVLILLTERPGFAHHLSGRSIVTRLILNRLGRESALAIIGSLVADKSLPDEVLKEIIDKTDGIPLFVEELTKTVLGSGLLRETEAAYVLDAPLGNFDIPNSLHDSLMARLDRLHPAREVAQTAACIGREFDYPLLAAVAKIDDVKLHAALEELVRTELVFRRRRASSESYVFKHALVRDVAYESLLKRRRQAIHADIAHILEERFAELAVAQPELVAHHLTESNLAEQAVVYWERAGLQALERAALVESTAHLNRAVEVLKALPDGLDRKRRELRLQILLAQQLRSTVGHGAIETRAALDRARVLSEQVSDTSAFLQVLRGQCSSSLFRADHLSARVQAERWLELANLQQDLQQIDFSHRNLAISLFFLGEPVQAREHIESVLDLFQSTEPEELVRRFGGDNPLIKALVFMSCVLQWLGHADQAARVGEKAIAISRESDHPQTRAFLLEWSILAGYCRRETGSVARHTQALMTLADEKKLAMYGAYATVSKGWLLSQKGEHVEGRAATQRGLQKLRATETLFWQPLGMTILVQAVAGCGRPAEGLEIIDDALAITTRSAGAYLDAELHRLKGVLLLAANGTSAARQAERCFSDSLAVARAQNARFWELRTATSLACLLRDRGERRNAADLLTPIYDWFTEGFDTPDLQEARSLLDELS